MGQINGLVHLATEENPLYPNYHIIILAAHQTTTGEGKIIKNYHSESFTQDCKNSAHHERNKTASWMENMMTGLLLPDILYILCSGFRNLPNGRWEARGIYSPLVLVIVNCVTCFNGVSRYK